MNQIVVLNDGDTWSSIEGCTVVTLSDEQLELISESDKLPDFVDKEPEHEDEMRTERVDSLDERDQNGDIINWRDVAQSFYYSCGAVNDCGDMHGIDNLCLHYAWNLTEKICWDCYEETNEEELEFDGEYWMCKKCKEYEDESDE